MEDTAPTSRRRPLRFGAIADVQFADVEDAWNFPRTQVRRYRGALDSLRLAVSHWRQEKDRLDFVADLGDIIDQQCESRGMSRACLARVLREWEPLSEGIPMRTERLIGNHELYNFSRAESAELIPGITPWYRSFRAAPGWRVVVLDPYDLNMIERGCQEAIEEGLAYLERHNPNDLRAPRGSVDVGVGLAGLQRRFLPMGGGIKEEQLRWLRRELGGARRRAERVIILTHLPTFPEATTPGALMWNYGDLLSVLREAEYGTVPLLLAGHYHSGGYGFDADSGTHHVTLPSPLHSDPDDPRAHCIVEADEDRIMIFGEGLVPSRDLPVLRQPPGAHNHARDAPASRL